MLGFLIKKEKENETVIAQNVLFLLVKIYNGIS